MVSRRFSAAHPLHANATVALPRMIQPLNMMFCCSRVPPSTATTDGETAQMGGLGSERATSTGDEIALSVENTIDAKPLTPANGVSRAAQKP